MYSSQRLEMRRIRRLWFRMLLFSTLTFVFLLLWNGINGNFSKIKVLDSVFAKDVWSTADDWREYNGRGVRPKFNHVSKNDAISSSRIKDKTKISVVNFLETYSTDDGYEDRDIEKEQQNARTDKSRTRFITSTKPTSNRDTTQNNLLVSKEVVKPAKISNGSIKLAMSTRNSQLSKQGLDMSSHPSKESIYGEQGCPDNPWREDLYDLFRTWVQISKQNNIEYVLACGSLLGAMRNGDVIPYDSDIDILIDINYFSIIKRLSVKRNFKSTDKKIHLVVQPEFTLHIPVEMRKRFDCQGKVCCFFLKVHLILLHKVEKRIVYVSVYLLLIFVLHLRTDEFPVIIQTHELEIR